MIDIDKRINSLNKKIDELEKDKALSDVGEFHIIRPVNPETGERDYTYCTLCNGPCKSGKLKGKDIDYKKIYICTPGTRKEVEKIIENLEER